MSVNSPPSGLPPNAYGSAREASYLTGLDEIFRLNGTGRGTPKDANAMVRYLRKEVEAYEESRRVVMA
jgi:hypothetical protein